MSPEKGKCKFKDELLTMVAYKEWSDLSEEVNLFNILHTTVTDARLEELKIATRLDQDMQILIRLVETCLATAKLRRPFPDYMWQCTLDAQKGLDVGNTCRTEKACKQSVRVIAEVERCHLHTTCTLVASSPSSVTDQQMHSSQKQRLVCEVRSERCHLY
ncbi:hypothetical protein NP493_833g00016 [Ridgeia piscesae]|uniref:Uncharacterized protein n=1 Tax=Ridgeia piscesae TaxID=27915 RepID=A0AAD9NNW2_RIDPI|nr:hypothetical protein NP493_833g00016 [Ridgeia piscesae]